MSSLVDYGDSDEELPSGEQCRRKRFENFADLPRPPKVARVREATPPSIDNSSSIHDEHVDLEASEECFQEVDHKKGNLKNIQLSADSISILHENVRKLLTYNGRGKSITQHIGESSQFQNPYCLETVMSAFHINPYASNFPSLLYDPKAIEIFEGYRFSSLQSAVKAQASAKFQATNARVQTTVKQSVPQMKISSGQEDKPHGKPRRPNKWDVK